QIRGTRIVLFSGAGGRIFELAKPLGLALINNFAVPTTRREFLGRIADGEHPEHDEAIDALIGTMALTAEDAVDGVEVSARWNAHDLLYHQIRTISAGAGAWHELGRRPVPPAVKAPMGGVTVALPDRGIPPMPLATALSDRRSVREFALDPIQLD